MERASALLGVKGHQMFIAAVSMCIRLILLILQNGFLFSISSGPQYFFASNFCCIQNDYEVKYKYRPLLKELLICKCLTVSFVAFTLYVIK